MRNNLIKKGSKKYPKWFYLFLLSIPIILIIIVELTFRAFGYGTDYSTFINIEDKFGEYYFFNPRLPEKYFVNSTITPSVIPDGFKINKDNNTFRIFAMGGSTTAGFPYPPNVSFPRLLKDKLEKKYPGIRFEVINLGISAVNSITMKDIIGDVVEQKPDLIIIYAGHNEYYGALGPASGLKQFSNAAITNLYLSLKNLYLVQFLENSIQKLMEFTDSGEPESKTLMAQMSGTNLIEYNSDLFFDGLNQFKENLDLILNECKEAGINVLTGTLVSNLMQEPLCKYSGCQNLITDFNKSLTSDTLLRKTKLYKIKDLDNLRFRAPEEMNQIIKDASQKFNVTVFDNQEIFEKFNRYGIIGDELMTDHLHPNIKGNSLIAELLFEIILDKKFIDNAGINISDIDVNPTPVDLKSYTKIDSSIAELRIAYLKQDFPFRSVKSDESIFRFIISKSDSIAWEILFDNLGWENGHLKLADYYYQNNRFREYFHEMFVLMKDKPFYENPFISAIHKLEKANQSTLLKNTLKLHFNNFKDLKSAEKLGDIYHSEGNIRESIKFYEYCVNNNSGNEKIHFNLSGLYFSQKRLNEAIYNMQKCLNLNPNYPNAQKIYRGLLSILKSKK